MIFIAYAGLGLAAFLTWVFLIAGIVEMSTWLHRDTPRGVFVCLLLIWLASMVVLIAGWFGVKAINAIARHGLF